MRAFWAHTDIIFSSQAKNAIYFITDITDKGELEEIHRIANRLDQDEKVRFVAKTIQNETGWVCVSYP